MTRHISTHLQRASWQYEQPPLSTLPPIFAVAAHLAGDRPEVWCLNTDFLNVELRGIPWSLPIGLDLYHHHSRNINRAVADFAFILFCLPRSLAYQIPTVIANEPEFGRPTHLLSDVGVPLATALTGTNTCSPLAHRFVPMLDTCGI